MILIRIDEVNHDLGVYCLYFLFYLKYLLFIITSWYINKDNGRRYFVDKKIIEHAKELLNTSESFLLSTNDRNGFPNTAVVSKPIVRASFHSLKFYVDGNGSTVKNITRNSKGNVCCYSESGYESLLLKGVFSIERIDDFKLIEERLNKYQKELNHENPVILSFEVYTVKVHSSTKTFHKEIDDFEQ